MLLIYHHYQRHRILIRTLLTLAFATWFVVGYYHPTLFVWIWIAVAVGVVWLVLEQGRIKRPHSYY